MIDFPCFCSLLWVSGIFRQEREIPFSDQQVCNQKSDNLQYIWYRGMIGRWNENVLSQSHLTTVSLYYSKSIKSNFGSSDHSIDSSSRRIILKMVGYQFSLVPFQSRQYFPASITTFLNWIKSRPTYFKCLNCMQTFPLYLLLSRYYSLQSWTVFLEQQFAYVHTWYVDLHECRLWSY